MTSSIVAERLQPSLLDRLTDDNPEKRTETADERVMDMDQLKMIVLRDLVSLLNTVNLEAVIDLTRYPRAQMSVINYGSPDMFGGLSSFVKAKDLPRRIKAVVQTFEPRVIPETLDIKLDEEVKGHEVVLSLIMSGELWAMPMPIELYMRTALDMNGGITVQEEDL